MPPQRYDGPWTSSKVRDEFLDFFKRRGHTHWPSSPTIPVADPSRLFANAGMNQYRPIFLGNVDQNSDLSKLRRACNSQKCIRVVDLDTVGLDNYHHTFFEMLGNHSFGDYFKKEAIAYSWELLTQVYKLPEDRLYVTYFEGDPKAGLEPDHEARQLWLDQGVAEDHIVTGNTKDNFWEMGPTGTTGPCGPCSEIHYDRIGGRNAAALVNQDDPDVLEIWNNVFITFNHEEDGTFKILPARHVDTGMGLERLVSVIQDRRSNYDTDLFLPIFDKIQEISSVRAYEGNLGAEDADGIDTAYRVVADHARTLTFALSDGGVPGETGRAYVLRQILRRGVWYAWNKLKIHIGSLFSQLVPIVVQQFGDAFPELTTKMDQTKEILDKEEASFLCNLASGEKFFEECISLARGADIKELQGKDAWRLYHVYGFPRDLIRLMAQDVGFMFNDEQFEDAQKQLKDTSGLQAQNVAETISEPDMDGLTLVENDTSKTDNLFECARGKAQVQVKGIYYNKSLLQSTQQIPPEATFGVLLDNTNLYTSGSGQETDKGKIFMSGKVVFEVEQMHAYNGYVMHIGHLKYGRLEIGDEVTSHYSESQQPPVQGTHIATHVPNHVLKDLLGG